MAYGVNVLSDLLTLESQSIVEFGENRLHDNLNELGRIHNALLMDQLDWFVEVKSGPDARLAGSGGTDAMVVEDMDEFATPDRQKVTVGASIGFPLRRHGNSTGWTLDWLKEATVSEVAAQFQAAMTADYVGVGRALRRAIYTPTNNDNYIDRFWRDKAVLPIKALINADSFPIPVNPTTGEAFDTSTHKHYLASTTLDTTAASALIATVREHFQSGMVRVLINHADAAAWRALTGFDKVINANIVQANDTTYVDPSYQSLNTESTYNRMIGLYDDAEIWVKPWIYANYPIAVHTGAGTRKTLRYRQRNPEDGQFRLEFSSDPRWASGHPLETRGWKREFGIAPQERVGMAVLFIGDTTYTMPTIV